MKAWPWKIGPCWKGPKIVLGGMVDCDPFLVQRTTFGSVKTPEGDPGLLVWHWDVT